MSGTNKSSAGPLTIGVDLGGTKVEAAVVDAAGRMLVRRRYPTDASRGAARIIAAVAACIRKCWDESPQPPAAVGIGIAGQVDAASGIVHFAPNLDWHEVPLQEELQRTLRLPVLVTNDVRAATGGEWLHGAGRDYDDLVCVFVGTGIGGGIVSGGRLLTGASNTAGEIGHMTVVAGGRRCHCPNRGCLEAYAGGWAIARRAQEAVRRDAHAGRTLLKLAGSIDRITAVIVGRAQRKGDPLSRRLVEETGHYLGAGIVGLVNGCNPRRVILGGGIIEGFPGLTAMLEQHVRAHALTTAAKELDVVRAHLANDAGVIGAAAMARVRALTTLPQRAVDRVRRKTTVPPTAPAG